MTKKIIVKKKLCWFHEAVSFNFHKLCIRSAIQNILVVGTSSSFLLDKELLNNKLYYQHFPNRCVTLPFQDSWRDLTRAFASGRSLLSLSGRLQVSGVTYVHIILFYPVPSYLRRSYPFIAIFLRDRQQKHLPVQLPASKILKHLHSKIIVCFCLLF